MLEQKLAKEVTLGKRRGGGAFRQYSFAYTPGFPSGPSPPNNGAFRLIHHLSYPDCDSANYFIDPDICNVTCKYTSIDEEVSIF